MIKKENIHTMILASMFFAIAFILPFFTGQIQQIGNMLCPMHIPVLLCGFICGSGWGLAVGFFVPLFRSIILGMPMLFPAAFCMAFELASYGFIAGFLYRRFPKTKGYIYVTLISSMIIGRLVWGIVMFICLGLNGENFGMSAFLAGAFLNAIPGIILQIILLPVLVMVINKKWEINQL